MKNKFTYLLVTIFSLALLSSCSSSEDILEPNQKTTSLDGYSKKINVDEIRINDATGKVEVKSKNLTLKLGDNTESALHNLLNEFGNSLKNMNSKYIVMDGDQELPSGMCELIIDVEKFVNWMGAYDNNNCDVRVFIYNGDLCVAVGNTVVCINKRFVFETERDSCIYNSIIELTEKDPTNSISIKCKK
ncbi:hypothetical protein [Chishuiella changwenlii]|uniref:hypothetical protein n=1 Tax=Chishuiella changwenlii TaxID=1434701 RepID=UPI002FD9AA1F